MRLILKNTSYRFDILDNDYFSMWPPAMAIRYGIGIGIDLKTMRNHMYREL